MITLYSGIPRSGKSYKMVSDLLDNKDKFYIVQNIEGLNLDLFPHIIDFRRYIENTETKMEFNEFFSKEYQVKFCAEIREKYGLPVLVIIDECHEWFDRSFKPLKMWLSYHGHLGQTVWLVTHKSTNLSSTYRSFIEIEYRAKSSSIIFLPGYFLYNRISGGVRVGYTKVRKRQEVFDAYKSQNDEYKKGKRSSMLPVIIALTVLGVAAFLLIPKYMIGGAAAKEKKAKEVQVQASKSVSSMAPSLTNSSVLVGQLPGRDILEEKFAFIGVMGKECILEDRKSGYQFILSRVPYGLSRLDNNGSNSLTAWSASQRKVITFYNCERFTATESGRPMSPQAGAVVSTSVVSASIPKL